MENRIKKVARKGVRKEAFYCFTKDFGMRHDHVYVLNFTHDDQIDLLGIHPLTYEDIRWFIWRLRDAFAERGFTCKVLKEVPPSGDRSVDNYPSALVVSWPRPSQE